MDMYDHPGFLTQLLAYSRDVAKRVAELYIDAGMDVIAIVDPLVSQISSRHFERPAVTLPGPLPSSVSGLHCPRSCLW